MSRAIQRVNHYLTHNRIDHRLGDNKRKLLVKDNYRSILDRSKELRELNEKGDINPHTHKHLKTYLDTEKQKVSPYFRSYTKFRNTQEDENLVWLFKEGLPLVKAWFEGWYMAVHTFSSEAINSLVRAFKALKQIIETQDKTLYRVMPVDNVESFKGRTKLVTGPRAIQSWTDSIKNAKTFYNEVYADGETMTVKPDGTIAFEDHLATNDFIIVKAKISSDMIFWTPASADELDTYDMHARDSKLPGYDYRISDKIRETLFKFNQQREYIVYVPNNRPLTIDKVIPLHDRSAHGHEHENQA